MSADDNMDEVIYKFEIAMSLLAPDLLNPEAIE